MLSKILSSVFLVILSVSANAAQPCADLSHVSKMEGVDVQVVQNGCEEWVRQQYFKGKPMGSPSTIQISPDWVPVEVDDAYETYSMKQRWAWSEDRKSVIHEVTEDSFTKATQQKFFSVESSYFSREGDSVVEKGASLLRTQESTGALKVTTDSWDRKYPILKH